MLAFLVCMISCNRKPDYSYPLKKYREMGIPDWSEAWTITDFGNVLGTLRNIKNSEPLSLPRKSSRKSGELFAHMVSIDNLYFLKVDSFPLHEKAFRIQPYIRIQNEYADIYTDIFRREQYYNEELVAIYIFGLSIVQEMLDLAYQINASDDPADIRMQSGYPAIQYTYMATLFQALKEQSRVSIYRTKDLEALGDSIALSIKRNMFWFDQDDAEQIKQKMRVVMDSLSSAKIRDGYDRIIHGF
jgi:hypothetical protein